MSQCKEKSRKRIKKKPAMSQFRKQITKPQNRLLAFGLNAIIIIHLKQTLENEHINFFLHKNGHNCGGKVVKGLDARFKVLCCLLR